MSKTGEPSARGLPKRFYAAASVAETGAGGYGVRLDGRPLRTPAKALFTVPSAGLARAIAAEWEAQGAHIDPSGMPLTRLANTAIDGVAGREGAVRADIAKYAGSDLLCYRAEGPDELVQRQAEVWDPVLNWAREALGAGFATGAGIAHVTQPDAAKAAVAEREVLAGIGSGDVAQYRAAIEARLATWPAPLRLSTYQHPLGNFRERLLYCDPAGDPHNSILISLQGPGTAVMMTVLRRAAPPEQCDSLSPD